MSNRDAATIDSVNPGSDNDHGGSSFWVFVKFDECGHQGFGGFHLSSVQCSATMAEICRVFGVSEIEELVGKKCFALKYFPGWGETICGLEAENGNRFVMADWCRTLVPEFKYRVPLVDRREHLNSTIASAERRIADARRELATCADSCIHWVSKG